MRENRRELDTLIVQVKEVLYAKDEEIKTSVAPVVDYVIAGFKKVQMEGFSFIKRAETDLSSDSAVILQYKNAAENIIIELNKIVL